MHFHTLLITATLYGLSLANYDINLYKRTNCKGTAGETCSNVAPGYCCSRTSTKTSHIWSRWGSAGFTETGGGASSDQIKAYTPSGDDACSLPVATSNTCASESSKQITGAAVFVVVTYGSRFRRNDAPIAGYVEPDLYFYEDGTTRHTLAIRSAQGEAFAKLDSEEDQINFLKEHGQRSPVN